MASLVAVGLVGAAASSSSKCGVRAADANNTAAYANWRYGAAQSYKGKKGLMACPATVGLVGVSGVDGFKCGVRGVNLHSTIGTNRWNFGAAQSYGEKRD